VSDEDNGKEATMKNVRNFWIEIVVDGKAQKVAVGPVSKTGGFDLTVYMNDGGESVEALVVLGRANVLPANREEKLKEAVGLSLKVEPKFSIADHPEFTVKTTRG
jgi:hypothetical protein